MQTWKSRPIEVAHLLNPAFCALVLRQAVKGFSDEISAGMPYPLAFLVLPIVLHRSTREALPRSIATKMHPWLETNQQVRVGFATRCANVVDHTREGLLYASALGLIAFSGDAVIQILSGRLMRPWPAEAESAVCLKSALFVGRWLARAGDAVTVYAMWGVRP